MFNLRRQVIAILLFSVVVFWINGCAPQQPFLKKYQVDTPKDAFMEILSRRNSILGFHCNANFEITSPKGKMNIRGRITNQDLDKWRIVFTGPFGIEVASIDLEDNFYRLTIPNAGKTEEGSLDDPLELSDLNIHLPRLDMIASILFPVVDLRDTDGWKLHSGKVADEGTLNIRRKHNKQSENIDLQLSYSTLEISKEERSVNNNTIFTRWFYYPQQSTPKRRDLVIETVVGEATIKVTYNNLTVEQRKDGIAKRK